MKRGIATFIIFAIVAVGYTVARNSFDATPTTTTEPSTNCVAQQLTTTWVDGTGAAGTLYAWVKITNSSSANCTIPTHPTVA